MNRFSLVVSVGCLVGAFSSGLGCSALSSSDDRTTIEVSWALKKADGTTDTCPSGYSKVRVEAQAYSRSGSTTGSPFVAMFDCGAGHGTISVIASGDETTSSCSANQCERFAVTDASGKYEVSVYVTEESGLTKYVETRSRPLDVSKGTRSAAFTLVPNGGYQYAGWLLQAKSTGSALTCTGAGFDTIRLHARRTADASYAPVSGEPEYVVQFPCDGQPDVQSSCYGCQGAAITDALTAGYYTVKLEAYSGSTLVGTSGDATDKRIDDRGRMNAVQESYAITVESR